MRGAFGKAHGTVARVNIGQILLSVRSTDKHREAVVESLRRSKFKFPGRQKIYVSKKWGFTKWDREDYEKMRADGRLRPDGANVKYLPEHGPLAAWCKVQAELAGI
jgi:large subunit ribosomal protein L10e